MLSKQLRNTAVSAIVVGVATTTLALADPLSRWHRTSAIYQQEATTHAEEKQKARELLVQSETERMNSTTAAANTDPLVILTEQQARLRLVYHAQMEHKYRRAAVIPWWPISPDPPEPQDKRLLNNFPTMKPIVDTLRFIEPSPQAEQSESNR